LARRIFDTKLKSQKIGGNYMSSSQLNAPQDAHEPRKVWQTPTVQRFPAAGAEAGSSENVDFEDAATLKS